MELQLGQIDTTKDFAELLWALLDDVMPGLKKLMLSKERKSVVLLQFGEQNDDAIAMHFYLVGDLKFMFMMLGRSGLLGSYCLDWKLKQQAKWKKKNIKLNLIYCGAKEWIIEKLASSFLLGAQPHPNARFPEAEKELLTWNFIPIENVIVSLLLVLLGLSDDALSLFWDCTSGRDSSISEGRGIQKSRWHPVAHCSRVNGYQSFAKQIDLETEVRNQRFTRKAGIQAQEFYARKNGDDRDT
jgi:hypothetical protein